MIVKNILLDMDGVLCDFFSPALNKLNKFYEKNITVEEYIKYNTYDISQVFNISKKDFWNIIDEKSFWLSLKPFDWSYDLFHYLNDIASVTICTSPSTSGHCFAEKINWIKKYLGLNEEYLIMSNRKYLMARSDALLIDDYKLNVNNFKNWGGNGILIPSNWNTKNLTYEKILEIIIDSNIL